MTQARLVSAFRSSGQRLSPRIGARVVCASTVMASNRGARGRAPVESIGLRSWGVIAVWGCALCVSPVEVDGWRAVGARRLRVASGCGDRWRVIRAIVVVILARVLLARVKFAPVTREVARYRFLWDTVAGFPCRLVVAVPRDFKLKVAAL